MLFIPVQPVPAVITNTVISRTDGYTSSLELVRPSSRNGRIENMSGHTQQIADQAVQEAARQDVCHKKDGAGKNQRMAIYRETDL